MMHIFKGNVGPGVFALGDAFKNSGLVAGPFMTLALGLVCVHSQHILVSFSRNSNYLILYTQKLSFSLHNMFILISCFSNFQF